MESPKGSRTTERSGQGDDVDVVRAAETIEDTMSASPKNSYHIQLIECK